MTTINEQILACQSAASLYMAKGMPGHAITLKDAASTLASVALIGERKVKFANDMYAELRLIVNADVLNPIWDSSIRALLSKIDNPNQDKK